MLTTWASPRAGVVHKDVVACAMLPSSQALVIQLQGLGPLDGVGEACSTRAAFEFAAPNSVLVRLNASRWYIANNPNGRPSLYHTRLAGGGVANEEVAEGVSAMSVTYLLRGSNDYVAPNLVGGNWANVIAARIALTLDGQPNTGTGGVALQRQTVHVVSLRNRNL